MGRNGADVIRTGKGLTECLGWGRRLWAVGMGVLLVNAAGFGEEDGGRRRGVLWVLGYRASRE